MNLCGFEVGNDRPFFLIAGPCVIESEALALSTAETLKKLTERLGLPFIYKSSFDKANRSSGASYRGPGIAEGLRILAKVKAEIGVPVITEYTKTRRWTKSRLWWTCCKRPPSSAGKRTSSTTSASKDCR